MTRRAHLLQQLRGAQSARRNNNLTSADAALTRTAPSRRPAYRKFEPTLRKLTDVGNRSLGNHLRARLLGQVEVVLHQSVLCPVATTRHAFTAVGASGSSRPDTAEIWVFDRLAGRAEVNTERSHAKSVAATHALGNLLDRRV